MQIGAIELIVGSNLIGPREGEGKPETQEEEEIEIAIGI